MYSYRLRYGTTSSTVYPRASDITKELSRSEISLGLRLTIGGSFEFVGVDFDIITAQPFYTRFELDILKDNVVYLTGWFQLKDTEIDYDNKILKTSLKMKDKYDELSEILDKEVDLGQLDIKKKTIGYKHLPLFQIYTLGDTELTNYQNGTTWKQECNPVNVLDVESSEWWQEDISGLAHYQQNDVLLFGGRYQISQIFKANSGYIEGFDAKYVSLDGQFFITYEQPDKFRWVIKQIQEEDLPLTVWTSDYYYWSETPFNDDIKGKTFTNSFGAGTTTVIDKKVTLVRLLVTDTFEDGWTLIKNKFEICSNPIYNKIVKNFPEGSQTLPFFDFGNSKLTQVSETKYGIAGNNQYFTQLVSENVYEYIPVCQDLWSYMSIWVRGTDYVYSKTLDNLQTFNVTAWHYTRVINAILEHFNVDLTVWSNLFYSQENPITITEKQDPYITNINNLQKSGVQATKNLIKLGDVLQFMKDLYNMSWHIENNTLFLEHISYYYNNNSYTTNSNYLDYTIKEVLRTEKMWSNDKNKVKFIDNAYKRKEFKQEFASDYHGKSIIETSYDATKVEKVEFGRIFTDISYHISGVKNVESGYIWIMTKNYKATLDTVYDNGYKKTIQNKAASLKYCTFNYYGYNDFGETINVDGRNVATKGKYYVRQQEVSFPIGIQEINGQQNIKTDIGIGFCNKIVIYLHDMYHKIELLHGIEY